MSKRTVATKWVALGTLLVALLLAGVISFYASGDPDGLNRVAIDKGFSDTESDHGAADGPFAGYGTSWIDNERLSGGLAGVVGVVVVLALTGGLARVVRRRDTAGRGSDATRQPDQRPVA
jgi:cobalt/nickel transport protein